MHKREQDPPFKAANRSHGHLLSVQGFMYHSLPSVPILSLHLVLVLQPCLAILNDLPGKICLTLQLIVSQIVLLDRLQVGAAEGSGRGAQQPAGV